MSKTMNAKARGFIWNMIGSGLVAFQSAILLFFCARFYGQETAGIVSISYAHAILAYVIGKYGVRNYQATDSLEKYSFGDYLYTRIITVIGAFALIALYSLYMSFAGGYTAFKVSVVICITALRMINAFEDVFFGRMQQMGFFEKGAFIMAVREFLTLLLIVILIVLKMELVTVLILSIVLSLVTEIVLVKRSAGYLMLKEGGAMHGGGEKMIMLLKECLPLCIGTSLAVYVSNIPKYVTDRYLDELSQAIVGYLLLPVFMITLFNQFVYTPFVKDLGDLWNEGDLTGFKKKILKQAFITALSSVVVLLLSCFIGIPLLSYVFAIDLNSFTGEFIVLLLGGGLYTLGFYLTIPVTIMHEQKKIAAGYIAAIIITLLSRKFIVTGYGIMGVGILYVASNLLMSVFMTVTIEVVIRKNREKGLNAD